MRILLVEDEKRMAQALCEILRLEKYEVDHYANGLDGLTAIESGIYDIVILDVMLPGMDGYQVTKQVRSKGITTPILTAGTAAASTSVLQYPPSSSMWRRSLKKDGR